MTSNLGSIQQNIEHKGEDDYEVTNLSKLRVTRWTVRGSTYIKVLSNYEQLMNCGLFVSKRISAKRCGRESLDTIHK